MRTEEQTENRDQLFGKDRDTDHATEMFGEHEEHRIDGRRHAGSRSSRCTSNASPVATHIMRTPRSAPYATTSARCSRV